MAISKTKLTFNEYSEVFQDIAILEYDKIIKDSYVREILQLDDDNLSLLALEYTCFSLFVMTDEFKESIIFDSIKRSLFEDVVNGTFCSIFNKNTDIQNIALYKDHYNKKYLIYKKIYNRTEDCLDKVIKNIFSPINPTRKYKSSKEQREAFVLAMIDKTTEKYKKVISTTTLIVNKDSYLFEVLI